MSVEGLTLYFDPKQSESRAVLSFFEHLNIPYKEMVYANGDHLKCPFFKKQNPFLTLPFLKDEEFGVAGAHTILRYICDAKLTPENAYYPRNDNKLR